LGAQADQVTQRLAHGLARTVQVPHVPPPGRLVVTLPPADVFDAPDTFAEIVDVRNGRVVARSANLGDENLPFLSEALAAARRGQSMARVVEPATNSMHVYSVPLGRGGRVVGVIVVARELAADERLFERLRLVLAVIGGLALPTAALIGWLLAERALAPIAEFAQAAEAIGRARDFSRRVIHRGPQDEVGHLAVTVNGMLAALEAAHRDLATAHARLEQALAAQQRFVADASHELRTPLTIIRANADILQWAAASDSADRARALADLASEAERMSGLVDRLLTLARADAGQRLALCPVPLQPLLEEAYRQARLLATGQEVVLEAAEDVTIPANRDALKQLVLILIENALKYTSPSGQVRLVLHRDGDEAHLTVADTGMGIAPADLPRIFERFYRADDARGSSGSGLGLAIAQWIAAQHQARIVVTSTPGQGSTFTVILPTPLPRQSAPPDS
jgi:signal transduction histidine kinase